MSGFILPQGGSVLYALDRESQFLTFPISIIMSSDFLNVFRLMDMSKVYFLHTVYCSFPHLKVIGLNGQECSKILIHGEKY